MTYLDDLITRIGSNLSIADDLELSTLPDEAELRRQVRTLRLTLLATHNYLTGLRRVLDPDSNNRHQ